MPIAAAGPLKVLTNPILIESAAMAGGANAVAIAPNNQNALIWIAPPARQWPHTNATAAGWHPHHFAMHLTKSQTSSQLKIAHAKTPAHRAGVLHSSKQSSGIKRCR